MKDPRLLNIKDFSYDLPDTSIAAYPLMDRTASQLLVYKEGRIQKAIFRDIGDFLSKDSLLVFNDTKVIHARIKLKSDQGQSIECFCLEPVGNEPLENIFRSAGPLRWKCMIGNARKWKSDVLIKTAIGKYGETSLTIKKAGVSDRDYLIDFSWDNSAYRFSDVLELMGDLPIPPYLNREAEPEDEGRYNTVFATHEGSVAAPTAGLHFTEDLLLLLREKGVAQEKLTLHVGAGTFRQVNSETMLGHEMHAERVVISKQVIQTLLKHKGHQPVIAVGTTSARSLESLYWLGVKLMDDLDYSETICVEQWIPYNADYVNSPEVSLVLNNLLERLTASSREEVSFSTRLLIAPGYDFKIVDALITNFHQPDSTLLLLVAALMGEKWRDVYNYALKNEFRFLSYGDACLLFKK